ncbi:1-deoxy-D-xylulose-5-phosphate reductoisomerase [Campylobacter sp. VBCF_05 NA6]|uniref:1-deoxy-D-xylulose-5-phosphate reductoisomerase n=1 Tax=unclassified Campylobacter TaxID=2593542 RepID=UPI0022E9DB33|nr:MULTISPECIES: 1-deoxy-D-xylulose-5-phosphate reductoisomerase [unclassified Campylobacter]MDA3058240.1 1-deoxy-D-xylulose-5-phosphate reductoisomerase [Campylobacter sp. VBCF_04 NA7]MDA3059810.1 1-deoxy-D-xylulose-5-phosphate reductoisomerase [Campylobacter sp. VBCF_05 NA6]
MVVLGSTGSIGTNTLDIAHKKGILIEALACGKNVSLLNEQIAKFHPKFVAIGEESLKSAVKHDKVFVGMEGILAMLEECKSSSVVNALVGFAGMLPSLKTQELGKTLCLANKESLVVGGKFLEISKIHAIDSEHFGLKFLIQNAKTPISRLIITASGGAFYDTPLTELGSVGAKDALRHPNWQMGAKITIDSASMANKLFEVIEAFWLYGTKNIDAVIERTSQIHALVEFIDGSTTAHISETDMRLAIAHAVLEGAISEQIVKPVNLLDLKPIKFAPIDTLKYPIFGLKEALLDNPNFGVVINAANEVGVYAFLEGRARFSDISRVVLKSVEKFHSPNTPDTHALIEIDRSVRAYANELLR